VRDRFSELTLEEKLALHHALVVLQTHPSYEPSEIYEALIEELWALACARFDEDRAKEMV